jgi:L-asparaginase/Glu-tRNA(Gln) amidotransferase subunit D
VIHRRKSWPDCRRIVWRPASQVPRQRQQIGADGHRIRPERIRRTSFTEEISMSAKPKVAVIGTGGTISGMSSLGSLDLIEYVASGRLLEADEIVARYPEVGEVADVIAVRFKAVPSTAI